MAIQRIAEGCDGAAYIDFDVDANLRLVGIIGRNAWISGKRSDGTGPTYTHTYGNVEETVVIPTAPNGRIQLTVHRGTSVDGFDASIELRCPTP